MGLKTVDAFVKQAGKQHVIKVYRKRHNYYFQTKTPPLTELRDWRLTGHIPPLKPWRDGYFIGRIVACRNRKTATAITETSRWTPVRYRNSDFGFPITKKFHIHDEYEICNPGDIVMFKHVNNHFSKIKKYGLVEVIRATPIWQDYPSWEGTTQGDFHLTHSNDPDRDDITSHTQRLMKAAYEQKQRKNEFAKNEKIKKRDRFNRQQATKITDQKINSFRDQISRWGV